MFQKIENLNYWKKKGIRSAKLTEKTMVFIYKNHKISTDLIGHTARITQCNSSYEAYRLRGVFGTPNAIIKQLIHSLEMFHKENYLHQFFNR